MERIKQITEDTVLPITLVLVLLGGVFWLSEMHSNALAAKTGVYELSAALSKINERLSRIEGKLGVN